MPVDVRYSMLAMGVTAQSSYIPFYPAATDVHLHIKCGCKLSDDKSAYWVYNSWRLVDAHYKEFSKILKDTQKKLQSYLTIKFAEMTLRPHAWSRTKRYLTSIACQQIGLDSHKS